MATNYMMMDQGVASILGVKRQKASFWSSSSSTSPSLVSSRSSTSSVSSNAFQYKFAYLVSPTSLAHVHEIYEQIFNIKLSGDNKNTHSEGFNFNSNSKAFNNVMMTCLGELTKAAVNLSPLIILGPTELELSFSRKESSLESVPNSLDYIHMADVVGIADEVDLKSPCHFILHFIKGGGASMLFSAPTSVTYSSWIHPLLSALKKGSDARLLASKRYIDQCVLDQERKTSQLSSSLSSSSPQSYYSSPYSNSLEHVDGIVKDARNSIWVPLSQESPLFASGQRKPNQRVSEIDNSIFKEGRYDSLQTIVPPPLNSGTPPHEIRRYLDSSEQIYHAKLKALPSVDSPNA